MDVRGFLTATVMVMVMLVLCFTAHVVADDQQNPTPEERLKKMLHKDYDPTTLPQRSINDTTLVSFNIRPQGAWIEEDKQVVHLNAWALLTWVDPRLTWDYKDYGGLKKIHLGDSEVWQPGIVLYNNADITKIDPYGNTETIIYSNGRVWWIPPVTLRAECPLDVTHWPFDTQSCDFFLGSWTRHGDHIDLEILGNITQLMPGWFMKYSNVWQYVGGAIVRHEQYYERIKERYVMLQVTINFMRVSPIFTHTVVLPSIIISILTLVQFVLPLGEPRRLVLGCVSLLLTLIHLIYLASVVPILSFSVPIVVKFFGQTLVVVVVSVLVNAILLRLTNTRQPTISSPPPAVLKNILTGPLGTVLFLRQYTEKVGMSGGGSEDGEVLEESRPASHLYEWLLVAAAIDRVAVVVFFITFFISLIAYIVAV